MTTPITALYGGLLGLLMLGLAMNVIRARVQLEIEFGDGGNPVLQQRQRVHGNAVEYVPIALLLLLLLELNGFSARLLHGLGGTLFAARVLHAWGLSRSTGTSLGRFAGSVATNVVLVIAAMLCLTVFFK